MAAVLTKCKGPKIFNAFDMSANGESDWYDVRHHEHISSHAYSAGGAGQTRAGTLRRELSNDGSHWVTYASVAVVAATEVNDMQNIPTEGASYYRERWEVSGPGLVGTLNSTCNRK